MKNRQKSRAMIAAGDKSMLELVLSRKMESLIFWNGSRNISLKNGSKDTEFHDKQINKLDKEIEDLLREIERIEEIKNGSRRV